MISSKTSSIKMNTNNSPNLYKNKKKKSLINSRTLSCILFLMAGTLYLIMISLFFHTTGNMNNYDVTTTTGTTTRIKKQTPNAKKVTVAYAISLVKCSDGQSSTAGLIDAALILRHSVHLTHITSKKYDYQMYVISTTAALPCARTLEKLGYTILLRDPPIQPSEIEGEHLRKHIHKEWCCGSDEFIKLFAYTLTNHSVVVHTDMDFAFLQPMEELFDAIIYDGTTTKGKEARKLLQVENSKISMPTNIEAMFTRDYHQIIPGRKAGYQAGFIVLKPNKQVFDSYLDVIRKGEYVDGFSRENGWGGKGYGIFVGAMAMQGLGAYFYDEIRPHTSVELNGCRYNFMAADVLYRNVPSFSSSKRDLVGKCRNGREYDCEDCTITDISLVKNVHYTNCRKPWNCAGESLNDSQHKTALGIDERTTNITTCYKVMTKWHGIRSHLEDQVMSILQQKQNTNLQLVYERWRSGMYRTNVFQHHCTVHGQDGYNPIVVEEEIGDVSDLLAFALKQLYA